MYCLAGRSVHELFDQVQERLRKLGAYRGGSDMLRLTVYEKVQNMVMEALITKDGKSYSGNKSRLQSRAADIEAANAATEARRREVAVSAG